MLIDIILNRKDGLRYSVREFYYGLVNYFFTWPNMIEPILRAVDRGNEDEVAFELCRYIVTQGYMYKHCNYIRSVKWLEDDPPLDREERITRDTGPITQQWKLKTFKNAIKLEKQIGNRLDYININLD